jgi:hypothetical protein
MLRAAGNMGYMGVVGGCFTHFICLEDLCLLAVLNNALPDVPLDVESGSQKSLFEDEVSSSMVRRRVEG